MGCRDYFENTPAVTLLRIITGGRLFPHAETAVSKQESEPEPEHELESGLNTGNVEDLVEVKKDAFLVTWDGEDDPKNPKNFSTFAKCLIPIQVGLLTFTVTAASSVYSGGMEGVMEEFHCSNSAAALGLSLFVVGYGIGPMIWGPLSEIPQIGRNLVYIPTLIVFVCLQVPTALAGNLGTLLSMRLLGGIIGSPCMAVGGASIIDVFEPRYVPYCLGTWGCIAGMGPMIGPLIGGFAFQLHNWRWTIWAILWMSAFVLALTFFFLPETSADKILSDKAARLRKQTGNPEWKSATERVGALSLESVARVYLIRPFAMLIYEPIVLLLSLYLALLYGIEYLFFEAFPFVYAGIYGWGPGVVGLSFFGALIGVFIGMAFQMWFIRYRYGGQWARTGQPPPLEEWLWTMLFGCFCVPISMFWFGWAAQARTHWIVPLIGSVPFGFALLVFFQGILNYLALAYQQHAASVLAANDLLRCIFGAAFPIFSHAMYQNLGVGWASSIPGFLSAALIPVPFIFYKYGAKIRAWSKYTS
ncbi:hypothetical protein A1O3_02134 [Capronia epimyces CBS 606.96]|uniref:Major facilitator superfamily (MFS) profile domain-containing protein n=1 Tax=Capronia epimyces CBS 606.96 TaxID=1182542 RepID=W9YHD1_9EURO|nr:uncharacterized protein A1O3_02134 [Capronia epimyces CBS 606.96]EXJ89070.1 hypothetical protein A1O3_02134 [Capronia epimyces CBS 606.96]